MKNGACPRAVADSVTHQLARGRTGSNVLFAEFQVAAAAATGLPPALTLAGQGMGAAIGNVIAPHNIVAGAATVGLIGSEGKVLRQTLPVCLAYVAAGGALLFVVSLW